MESVTSDANFFVQTKDPYPSISTWNPQDDRKVNIVRMARSMLGNACSVQSPIGLSNLHNDSIYNVLSMVLPAPSEQSAFFWETFCRSLAVMLHTANYPEEVQCRYLLFVYARILGFMGPQEKHALQGSLTVDGSTGELGWLIPADELAGSNDIDGSAANKQIRFTILPTHPKTGRLLRGSSVIEYLLSGPGSLGLVYNEDGALSWVNAMESYLFGTNASEDHLAPESSGCYIAFVLPPRGKIAIKVYYQTPVAPKAPLSTRSNPVYVGDQDLTPLRQLVDTLDSSGHMRQPFEGMLEYFTSLRPQSRPLLHMLSVDVTGEKDNRLKIYVQVPTGRSFTDAVRSFTWGGRLNTPGLEEAVATLKVLWDLLFPATPADSGLEPEPMTDIDRHLEEHWKQLPVGSFICYYEFHPGRNVVFPKIYFPARHYCASDLAVCNAIEGFYACQNYHGPAHEEIKKGWVASELAKAFTHRSLAEKPGITTWVSFGSKSKGWELVNYFSPEMWLRSALTSKQSGYISLL